MLNMGECWSVFHSRCWLLKWRLLNNSALGFQWKMKREAGANWLIRHFPLSAPRKPLFVSNADTSLYASLTVSSWLNADLHLGVKPKCVRIPSMTQHLLSHGVCRRDQPIEWWGKGTPDILVTLDFAELDSGPHFTHFQLKNWMSWENVLQPLSKLETSTVQRHEKWELHMLCVGKNGYFSLVRPLTLRKICVWL